jgi:translation initiation factor IF-1
MPKNLKTDDLISVLIESRVEKAMEHPHFRLELADGKTGLPLSAEKRRESLRILFGEIIKGMGLERFAETPVELLDQFAVMSVVKDDDTAGLLRSLINSFVIAYSTPETSDRAFLALTQLEDLRAEVAKARVQTSDNTAVH